METKRLVTGDVILILGEQYRFGKHSHVKLGLSKEREENRRRELARRTAPSELSLLISGMPSDGTHTHTHTHTTVRARQFDSCSLPPRDSVLDGLTNPGSRSPLLPPLSYPYSPSPLFSLPSRPSPTLPEASLCCAEGLFEFPSMVYFIKLLSKHTLPLLSSTPHSRK